MQNHYSPLLLSWEEIRKRGYEPIGLVVRDDLANRWGHQWESAHRLAQFLPIPEKKRSLPYN
ncbi:MAG: hypothetical protein CMI18_00400 [Opitutaceae bacterium]|nr:hypothetical protein [Opitutaceae bacterium]